MNLFDLDKNTGSDRFRR